MAKEKEKKKKQEKASVGRTAIVGIKLFPPLSQLYPLLVLSTIEEKKNPQTVLPIRFGDSFLCQHGLFASFLHLFCIFLPNNILAFAKTSFYMLLKRESLLSPYSYSELFLFQYTGSSG